MIKPKIPCSKNCITFAICKSQMMSGIGRRLTSTRDSEIIIAFTLKIREKCSIIHIYADQLYNYINPPLNYTLELAKELNKAFHLGPSRVIEDPLIGITLKGVGLKDEFKYTQRKAGKIGELFYANKTIK
jgi:hypothetical protein